MGERTRPERPARESVRAATAISADDTASAVRATKRPDRTVYNAIRV
jgi:hypothetical protein